jgi:hypothetical protein
MEERSASISRLTTSLGRLLGAICLGASLLLMSPGVATVRAESGSADSNPELEPAPKVPAPPIRVEPARVDGEIESAPRAERRSPSPARDGIVLNTRGYNYGPDRPTIQPVLAPAPAPASPANANE